MSSATNGPEQTTSFPSAAIWERLDPRIPFQSPWHEFRHRQQGEFLHHLAKHAPFDIGLSHIGLSDEGRVLHTLRFGKGARRVLVWARQHGNEPDCSAGLSMALTELVLHPEDYPDILNNLELGILPMVNPDGVARFTRRNAQGIDLNRDAVALATPEAKALLAIKNSLKPEFCFNLHDMGPRKSTKHGKLVALAYQAGPFEPRDIDNDVRLKAKHVIGLMNAAAQEFAPGHTAKYTADYMHRAFGDSMMRWGVSSILIEAGGWYRDRGGDDFVQRLFALSLLRGLHAVATAEDATPSGDAYDTIPFDSGNQFSDVILHGGQILNGAGRPPFRADIAVNVNVQIKRAHDPTYPLGIVTNIGDLEDDLAKQRIDLRGKAVMPGFIAVSAGLHFDRDRPSTEDAKEFLRAGVTSLVCGFGPFASNRAREQWMEACCATAPPINIIAFERVGSLREIRSRHGMSELAGLLVQDLVITAEELLNFTHLFHPAQNSAIEGEFAGKLIGVDIFFQGSSSPSTSQLHLHLTPSDGKSGHTPVRQEEIRLLADEFLRSPGQISLSMDALQPSFDWLPILVGFGGLSHGRRPHPNYLGNILKSYGADDTSGIVGALNMLTLLNSQAFRLGNTGKIEIDRRADLVTFHESLLEGGKAAHTAVPEAVILNGQLVYDVQRGIIAEGEGVWHHASPMTQR